MPDYAKLCRQIRDQHGWTQQQLAEVIGVSRRSVENYEQGRFVPNAAARKTLEVLSCTTPAK